MKLNAILTAVRKSRSRDDLYEIINAAEQRDAKLAKIESEKERARLWAKVEKLGLVKGDMVFIHAEPRNTTKRERYTRPSGKTGYRQQVVPPSGQHANLWGKPLTVHAVLPRAKEVVVRAPGSTREHRLSPFTCERLKLSKEPSTAALAAGLSRKSLLAERATASLY